MLRSSPARVLVSFFSPLGSPRSDKNFLSCQLSLLIILLNTRMLPLFDLSSWLKRLTSCYGYHILVRILAPYLNCCRAGEWKLLPTRQQWSAKAKSRKDVDANTFTLIAINHLRNKEWWRDSSYRGVKPNGIKKFPWAYRGYTRKFKSFPH